MPDRTSDTTGVIAAFPMASRQGQIDQTIAELLSKNGAEADAYWKDMIAATRAQLTAAGLSEDVVVSELRSFAEAVLFGIDEINTALASA